MWHETYRCGTYRWHRSQFVDHSDIVIANNQPVNVLSNSYRKAKYHGNKLLELGDPKYVKTTLQVLADHYIAHIRPQKVHSVKKAEESLRKAIQDS